MFGARPSKVAVHAHSASTARTWLSRNPSPRKAEKTLPCASNGQRYCGTAVFRAFRVLEARTRRATRDDELAAMRGAVMRRANRDEIFELVPATLRAQLDVVQVENVAFLQPVTWQRS